MKNLLLSIIYISTSFFAHAEESCISDALNPSTKAMNLTGDSMEIACAKFKEENRCQDVEPEEKIPLNPNSLADALISKDMRGQKLIDKLHSSVASEDKTISKSKLEAMIKNKIIEFVKVKNCRPAFGRTSMSLGYDKFGGKATYTATNGDSLKTATSKMEKTKKDSAFIENARTHRIDSNNKNFYDRFSQKSPPSGEETFYFCNQDTILKTEAAVPSTFPKCTTSVVKYFADNKAVLNDSTAEARLNDQKILSGCIQRTKAAGYEEKSITIISSANQLRNTSTPEEIRTGVGFCGYDFQGLSNARAKYVESKVLPSLVDINPKVPITIQSAGDNGNGSSGPCPYNSKGKLKAEYSGKNKDLLDPFKKTEVVVEFMPTAALSKSNADKKTISLKSNCEGLMIKCSDE